jgi:hypothetical protein
VVDGETGYLASPMADRDIPIVLWGNPFPSLPLPLLRQIVTELRHRRPLGKTKIRHPWLTTRLYRQKQQTERFLRSISQLARVLRQIKEVCLLPWTGNRAGGEDLSVISHIPGKLFGGFGV